MTRADKSTVEVRVGNVRVGGGAPVAVQSMTLTDTADATATAAQCIELVAAGSELVRVTVNQADAAAAVPEIKQRLLDAGCGTLVELGPGNALTGMARRIDRGVVTLSVRSPADIDPLLESVGARGAEESALPEGESLYAYERLVVAPTAGVFTPARPDCKGSRIVTGAVLGEVSGEPVRSPFSGVVMDYLAVEGERVTTNQPIAWLRTD